MSLQVACGHLPGPTPIAGRMAGPADTAPPLRSPWRAALDGLAATAKSLAERPAPELGSYAPEDTAVELAKRLEQAKEAAAAASALQSGLQQANSELAAAQQKQLAVQASSAPLMTAAAVDKISDLGSAIERSDLRREIEHNIESAETGLSRPMDCLSRICAKKSLASGLMR